MQPAFDMPSSILLILLLAIPLVAIVGGLLLAALKILKGDRGRDNGLTEQEETRMIQELHRGLNRLEDRVEALETLLLERSKDRNTHD